MKCHKILGVHKGSRGVTMVITSQDMDRFWVSDTLQNRLSEAKVPMQGAKVRE